MLTDANLNLSAAFGTPITSPPADRTVREGDVFEEAGIRLEVLEIPGHSPGHVVFVHRATPIIVLGGDVLFRAASAVRLARRQPGRCFCRGIRSKLFTLPATPSFIQGTVR